jgi:hypothetical protein
LTNSRLLIALQYSLIRAIRAIRVIRSSYFFDVRTALSRALMGGWLLWFTATVAQPPQVRVCPIHVSSAHEHGGHAMHGASSHSPAGHHATCDCPDECRCGAPTVAPVAAAFSIRAPRVVSCADPAVDTTLAVALLRAHALPFANAPPVPTVALLA